jgi:hypothetical protein
MKKNKNCDHIEFSRVELSLAANILRTARIGCTPYAIGSIPFLTTHKPTPSDCLSCKYFSGDQLLKCAVNPKRMMDVDCAEYERN